MQLAAAGTKPQIGSAASCSDQTWVLELKRDAQFTRAIRQLCGGHRCVGRSPILVKVGHCSNSKPLYLLDLPNLRIQPVLGTFIRFSNDNIHDFMRGRSEEHTSELQSPTNLV